jgi:hypothetical protein
MLQIIKPPAALLFDSQRPSLFLAGSIAMGQAEPWQTVVEQALADLPITILNPRRDEWDATWVQSIANPPFRAQVEWELEAQERADLIIMYFAPQTQAPITLLEFGLFATSQRLIVCCPDGFWRKGNIEVVCARYAIPLTNSLNELLEQARQRLESRMHK